MGKILCFIYNNMADFELTLPVNGVMWMNREIVTIAYSMEVVKAKCGILYQPHTTVSDAINIDDVDGLIIPGGWNNEQKDELTKLIQKLNAEKKLLAAICAGPQYLARAGVLKDKKYTTTLTKEELDKQGIVDFFPRENFVNEKVVRDQNIVTAIGRSFVDFTMEIIDFFNEFNDEKQKQQYKNYYKGL